MIQTIKLGDCWAASCRGHCGTREVEGQLSKHDAILAAEILGWKDGLCTACQAGIKPIEE